MPEHELERVMLDFVDHRFDMLLATTIVESGLDIPNANTIFIDEADRYGLADLHQLRGRVGRYKHRAYCYLLVDPNKHLSPNAARRLRAIEEFSDMGAGFAIAMRDLEIRGAGNILGTEQSGHIAAVGYETLLRAAGAGRPAAEAAAAQDLDRRRPGFARRGLSSRGYVPDMRLKIDLYRRLARVSNRAELADFRGELRTVSARRRPAVRPSVAGRNARRRAPLANPHDPSGGPVCGVRLHLRPANSAIGGHQQGAAADRGRPAAPTAVGGARTGRRNPFSSEVKSLLQRA